MKITASPTPDGKVLKCRFAYIVNVKLVWTTAGFIRSSCSLTLSCFLHYVFPGVVNKIWPPYQLLELEDMWRTIFDSSWSLVRYRSLIISADSTVLFQRRVRMLIYRPRNLNPVSRKRLFTLCPYTLIMHYERSAVSLVTGRGRFIPTGG